MTNVENFELYSNIQEFEKYRLYSTHAIQSDYEVIVPPGDNAKQTIYFEVKRFHKFELYYKYIDKEFKINIGVENYKVYYKEWGTHPSFRLFLKLKARYYFLMLMRKGDVLL